MGSTLERRFRHWRHDPPVRTASVITLVIIALVLALVWLQFRGALTTATQLTLMAGRSGLSTDPGAKVTYNGVQVGRVTAVEAVDVAGEPKAKLLLDVMPRYIELIPANVDAEISATTLFGNKYVSFSSPESPAPQRISSADVIDVSGVTTEFNSLFETVVSLTQQVDPIKLNQTLTATAQALDGLGDRFGQSVVDANDILTDVNAQMPQIQGNTALLADLGGIYADAAP